MEWPPANPPPPITKHLFAYPTMNILKAIRLRREACALQHTALNTEKSYVRCLKHCAGFLQGPQVNPLASAEAKLEVFLTQLALRGVSASTQNQAFNALLFFYR
jgi:site-specific recombinase XerD